MSETKLDNKIVIFIIILVGVVAYFLFFQTGEVTGNVIEGPGGTFVFEEIARDGIAFHQFSLYAEIDRGEMQEHTFQFRNSPAEVEHISVNPDIGNHIVSRRGAGKEIIITVDPESSSKSVLAGIELAQVLGNSDSGLFKMRVRGALTKLREGSVEDPNALIVTCDDVEDAIGVIYLEEGVTQGATLDEKGCIHLSGETPEEVIATTERLLYSMLGVLEF